MTDLNTVIDAMLPGDSVLGMPSASTIDFETYLMQHNINQLSFQFIQMLDKICEEKKGMSFVDLEEVQKMQAINSCKLVDVRIFSAMVGHLLKAYYTAPGVLMKIKSGVKKICLN